MSSIIVRDLAASKELDRKSLCAIRGGNSWLAKAGNMGPLANVNININQSVQQLQQVNVAAFNNNTLVGVDLGNIKLGVNPSQWGGNWAAA
ncbi:hypothetical protein D3C87_1846130 [compost metagenome]|jgi:hypothetical protein|uniref:Uncharacterized protein n=1 Tax=Cupriavidus campinensis TaxID=151783 RepID=A0AAE9L1E5_9BURK|nr:MULTISPECIES: hypothetical protein [Cupriavidus]TSP11493.1 hypothetical protein FGG12_17815 [Cupriavidus campinensis]URF03239.1 hypothetical protein M5D45_11910 [Cupriavidus campinensis]CAG2145562.1 hypothetical protein LMG19282_02780 [Cupriavidus campinensis]SFB75681.1 hypothetical protein SAMN05216321_101535 [Cupriavidus sp. OV038]SFO63711.1 hypothetical protein SAMN05216322_101535 [Cupriavidus sp. OV096]